VNTADERPESLAAQAASWVPPWERPQRPPDRDYQAATTTAESAAGDAHPDDDEDRSAAGLSDDDDDFDEAFESDNPEGYDDVPEELPPVPGESSANPTVDAPTEVPGETEPDPTDVGSEPEVPLPSSIESAVAGAEEEELGRAVDAPLPPDGDDAGDVFDAAADDDVSDDGELDLPFHESDSAALRDGTDPGGDSDEESGAPEAAGDVEGAQPGEASEAFAAGQADAAAALGGEAAGTAMAASVPAQGRGAGRSGGAVGDGSRRTENDLEGPADVVLMDDAELRPALEAILLVVDEPVAEMQLAQILEQPTERVAAMLEDISARYTAAGHGFDLRRAAGGWRLYTRPEYAAYVERFVLDGQSVRLTQAALETLAVVAYKQPVTRSRISAIRGVNCDGVMRTLVTRGLIEECGTEGETGAHLYRTTPLFLEKLGLNSVDQLPPLAPFLPDDVEEVLDASG
jgi:segregation and condensation protein B